MQRALAAMSVDLREEKLPEQSKEATSSWRLGLELSKTATDNWGNRGMEVSVLMRIATNEDILTERPKYSAGVTGIDAKRWGIVNYSAEVAIEQCGTRKKNEGNLLRRLREMACKSIL